MTSSDNFVASVLKTGVPVIVQCDPATEWGFFVFIGAALLNCTDPRHDAVLESWTRAMFSESAMIDCEQMSTANHYRMKLREGDRAGT